MEKQKGNRRLIWLAVILAIGIIGIGIAIPTSIVFYAGSKVEAHLGKPVSLADAVVSESGNLCIGFREKDSTLKLITYYYTIPEGHVRMRPSGTDLMINVDN